jgi:ubiquinone/menaquinone biosynthesis C-methylase UbiE
MDVSGPNGDEAQPGAAERARFEGFYGGKWAGHDGFWAERYPPEHRVFATAVYGRRNDAIFRAAGPAPGRVLDGGCGLGDVAALLGPAADRVIASDLSWENVRRASDNLVSVGSASVVQAAAERLPFDDGSLDTVVLADVIEHVFSVDEALREVTRVLRPGGRVICVTPIRATLRAWRTFDEAMLLLARRGRAGPVREVRDGVPERFLSKAELRSALRAAGLRPVAFERICFYPAPETAGALGSILARIHRNDDAAGFDRAAEKTLRILGWFERLGLLNQKQLWVAAR